MRVASIVNVARYGVVHLTTRSKGVTRALRRRSAAIPSTAVSATPSRPVLCDE